MLNKPSEWNFLTNHAHVFFYLAQHADRPLREVAQAVGITERAVQRIVTELEEAGYLSRKRKGRRNSYHFDPELPLRHELEAHCKVGDLLAVLSQNASSEEVDEERVLENWTIGEHGSEV